MTGDKCRNCGKKINERYTYCRDCYYKLGSPKNTVFYKSHKCRNCGTSITGKYNYCMSCAKVMFPNSLGWLGH